MYVRPFVHSLLGRARGIGIDDEHEHVGGFARVVCHGASPEGERSGRRRGRGLAGAPGRGEIQPGPQGEGTAYLLPGE